MGFLALLVIIAGGAVAIVVISQVVRPRGPVEPIILLVMPNGPEEATLMLDRLKSAGIRAHVQNFNLPGRVPYNAGGIPAGFTGEIWVREKDYEAAREVLGLGKTAGRFRPGP